MKKAKIKKNEKKEDNELSFFEKCKTDKKYKAKAELIGYGVFIVILIVYLNISSMNSNSGNYQNVTGFDNLSGDEDKETEMLEEAEWIFDEDVSYEYDILVSLQYSDEEKKEIRYVGKRYEDEMIIEREVSGENNTYYKIGSMYYTSVLDEYSLIEESEIYDFVNKSYIELDEVSEYLEIASLDHVTDYSSGKKEYVYHLSVRDVVKTYTGDEKLEFLLVFENGILTMKVDYSNLIKVVDDDVLKCEIEYTYRNMNKVEEFHVMKENDDSDVSSSE